MGELEKILLSWADFGRLSQELSETLKQKYEGTVDVVIGIAKGGLPLSMVIANELGTNWDSIRIKSYLADGVRGEMTIEHGLHHAIEGKNVMLVDDIVDEGKTMQFALEYLNGKYRPKKIITATLFLKSHSKFIPDEYFEKNDNWIVFPWEAASKK